VPLQAYSLLTLEKGNIDPFRCRKSTAKPSAKKHSTLDAPLLPLLKLSMNRTMFFSSGTMVPPEVTSTIGTVECAW